MANRLCHLFLLAIALLLLVRISNADQVTLGESTGDVKFTNDGGNTVDFNFTGSCGHSNCVSGLGLFGSTIGSYKIWITGGPPQLETPDAFDIYPVNEEGGTIHFSMVLNNWLGTLTGTVDLQFLSGGSTIAPEFLGGFTAATTTGLFVGAFPIGVEVPDDLVVRLPRNLDVDDVYLGIMHSVQGPLSTGEILSTPEPTTLGLLGSGLLTMTGLLKRRLF